MNEEEYEYIGNFIEPDTAPQILTCDGYTGYVEYYPDYEFEYVEPSND